MSCLFLLFISGVNVYKCVGHQYSTIDPNENVNTLYIAIPVHYVTTPINVGDVVVGNHSNGFLERVNEVRQDRGRTFIHTELTRCADNVRIRFVQGRWKRGWGHLPLENAKCGGIAPTIGHNDS